MLNNLNITEKDYGICINNPDYFLTFSDFTVSDGIDIVENINIIKSKRDFNITAKKTETFNQSKGAYISQATDNLNYFSNTYNDLSVFTFMENNLFVQDFTDKLKVINCDEGFENAKINLSHVIYINKKLSPKDLIRIYKIITVIKAKFLASLNLPLHIDNILNNDDFLAVASNIEASNDKSFDINDSEFDEIDFNEFRIILEDAVIISLEDAFKKLELTLGILDYFVSHGILIGDLVEAGMELLDGVEPSDELNKQLESQILKSLSDINVITLMMMAIRFEQDLSNNRIREIDTNNNSDYLCADEVLGMAVSNQITGTKAMFNFKHYIEAKPGIIYGLPSILEDVFAGLIAGCMSKIFEE